MRRQNTPYDKHQSQKLFREKTVRAEIVLLVGLMIFCLATTAEGEELKRTVEKITGQKMIARYYRDDREIATETIQGNEKSVSGVIADGIYRESIEGRLKYEWPYSDGKLEGTAVEYYDGRRIKYETDYKQGYKHGTSKYYSSMGRVLRERAYKLDKLEGLTREFFSTGELQSETLYAEGQKNGPSTEYYKNGRIKSEKKFENGELVGTKLYGENGLPVKTKEGE